MRQTPASRLGKKAPEHDKERGQMFAAFAPANVPETGPIDVPVHEIVPAIRPNRESCGISMQHPVMATSAAELPVGSRLIEVRIIRNPYSDRPEPRRR